MVVRLLKNFLIIWNFFLNLRFFLRRPTHMIWIIASRAIRVATSMVFVRSLACISTVLGRRYLLTIVKASWISLLMRMTTFLFSLRSGYKFRAKLSLKIVGLLLSDHMFLVGSLWASSVLLKSLGILLRLDRMTREVILGALCMLTWTCVNWIYVRQVMWKILMTCI